jgi:hypothetical protein
MNTSLEENISFTERNFLTIDEAVKVLWEWRRYRNEAMWHSVYRFGAVSVALTIAPYLLPNLIDRLGLAIFVFPVMAFLLSVYAAYLIAVQYRLYKQVDRKYRSLLGKYNLDDLPTNRLIYRIFQTSFGIILSGGFLCFAVIVEFFNGLVLLYLVHSAFL